MGLVHRQTEPRQRCPDPLPALPATGFGRPGPVFCQVTGNTIHDIHVRRLFTGAEMAGIKFHAAIDTEISGNHIPAPFSPSGLALAMKCLQLSLVAVATFDRSLDATSCPAQPALMKIAEIPQIQSLSVAEKMILVEDLWNEIIRQPERVPIPEWHVSELEQDFLAYQADPQQGARWDEVKRRILRCK